MDRKIGVFVCHCGINISKTVDVEALTKYASLLDDVVVSENYKYMCSDLGAQLIKKSIIFLLGIRSHRYGLRYASRVPIAL